MAQVSQERDLQMLLQSQIFRGLEKEKLRDFIHLGQWKALKKGNLLFRQGDQAKSLFILTEGKVKLTQLNPDGNQVVLRILGPKQLLAAISAIEDSPYPATAEILEKATVFACKRGDLLDLMKNEAQIGINVMKILIARIQELQDRFRELATQKVETRLYKALLRLSKQLGRPMPEGILIDLSLSRQDLAEITGSTLYTVSRILTQWEKLGWIRSQKKKILLKNIPRLEKEFSE